VSATSNGVEDCEQHGKGKQKAKQVDMGAAGIELERDEVHIMLMSRMLATNSDDYPNLKYIGLGKKVFEIGGMELVDEPTGVELDGDGEREMEKVWRRKVRRVPEESVMHMEVWGMDTTEI